MEIGFCADGIRSVSSRGAESSVCGLHRRILGVTSISIFTRTTMFHADAVQDAMKIGLLWARPTYCNVLVATLSYTAMPYL